MNIVEQDIKLMGIVNLTDNSYFAKSRCIGKNQELNLEKVYSDIKTHLDNGADIIDIGACSTRPNSIEVGAEIEWQRLEPSLKLIKENFPNITLSIDTYWADIVKKSYDLYGEFIVNDISSGENDSDMLECVGRLGLEYIAMHKRGNPQNMQSLTDYGTEGVVNTVLHYFEDFSKKAEQYNINKWILDVGFGFAKTIEQNDELLKNLSKFKSLGKELLVGISRKSMIYRRFNITPEESLAATQVLHLIALQNGANILRVHDIAEAKQSLSLYRTFFTNK